MLTASVKIFLDFHSCLDRQNISKCFHFVSLLETLCQLSGKLRSGNPLKFLYVYVSVQDSTLFATSFLRIYLFCENQVSLPSLVLSDVLKKTGPHYDLRFLSNEPNASEHNKLLLRTEVLEQGIARFRRELRGPL